MERHEVEKKIAEMIVQIVRRFAPQRVILFGSWAWGTPGPDSDVDLLILMETDDTRKLARQIDSTLFPRPFPIDVLVCRPQRAEFRAQMGDTFYQDIFSKGKVLYAV